jgi:glycosyltransferase involved in cell wall biosynthesis
MRIAVLIATSHRRTTWLAERCLPSVYGQLAVSPADVEVVVIDDNADDREYDAVREAVAAVRMGLGLPDHPFATRVLRNARTRGHSGTGAWNTGLDFLTRSASGPPRFVSLLDDDDEYMPRHLSNCAAAAESGPVAGVFECLEWVHDDRTELRPLLVTDLTPEAFFVGNPGVQGSNMFLRVDCVAAIGGFDEALPNTTDRDLMIRLLRHAAQAGLQVRALATVGARYFNHSGYRVNTDLDRKHQGLDLFYAKHRSAFTSEQFDASLDRARRLFGYGR